MEEHRLVVSTGDLFPPGDPSPRYRALVNLGYGSYGTVWLARDLFRRRPQYVAIKIRDGSPSDSTPPETTILRKIRALQSIQPPVDGSSNIIQLQDDFTFSGPGGLFYHCLVTDIIVAFIDHALTMPRHPEFLRQIVRGFSFLHENMIVHGDFHAANLGLALPDFGLDRSEKEILDAFEIEVAEDAQYPFAFGWALRNLDAVPKPEECQVKILDFGKAYEKNLVTSHKTSLGCGLAIIVLPKSTCIHSAMEKPELFGLYSMFRHISLVYGSNMEGFERPLYDYYRLGGSPPAEWNKYWDINSFITRFLQSGDPKRRPLPADPFVLDREQAWAETIRAHERISGFGIGQGLEFLDMMKKIIITDPSKRLTMRQVLDHPYWTSALRSPMGG
ncbi:kinase-like domain-containing protein [Xylariaceae sp. FL1272]|nr:kinase-like domain-containing protein [Xylariaceae sp. FL1272]